MKTRIIISLIFMSVALTANAQTRYYQTETTYRVGANTLKATIDEEIDIIDIHDVNARFTDVPLTLRNGEELPYDMAMGRVEALSSPPAMFTRANNIISESLSAQSKQLTKGRRVVVRLIFNPDTGKVWEVHFRFDIDSPYTYVTPAEYVAMMTKLKNEIYVTINTEGKKLNYVPSTWLYDSK